MTYCPVYVDVLKKRFQAFYPTSYPGTADFGDYVLTGSLIKMRREPPKDADRYLSEVGYRLAASHDCASKEEFPFYYWVPSWV